jgi:predicted N-acyltransferase
MSASARHYEIEQITSVREIGADDWNGLLTDGDPFMRHEFLAALETSGCIGGGTAWRPCHLLARDDRGDIVGAMPLYWKYDSRGEFVFDWSWAEAYERAGMSYYPKLVCSVPFTPATGRRLLTRDATNAGAVGSALVSAALELAAENDASSLHVLFPKAAEANQFLDSGFLERKGCQFHWHNDGYSSFDDFLSRFSSEKRKKARRERRRVAEAGIEFERLRGNEPSETDWEAIYQFYARTFARHGHAPYLNREFFTTVARVAPESLVIILARFQGQPIATAICFRSADTLYGRYWGCLADFHSLHFEACYYQGIEYCIENGLQRFEPGTQGEHKISRGFRPTSTWSYHWLANRGFHSAVSAFLAQETAHVDTYMDDLEEHVPYRRGLPRISSS